MGGGTEGLSNLIAEIWDRSHHMFKTVAGSQVILRWLMSQDDLTIEEEEAFGTDTVVYPATWASGSFNSDENIYWSEGVWD